MELSGHTSVETWRPRKRGSSIETKPPTPTRTHKQSVFSFNHISQDLDEDNLRELKSLYRWYHRLAICYKWKHKHLKRRVLALNMASVSLTVVGGVVGGVTLNPIVIGVLSGSGVMIQGYLTKSNIARQRDQCKFAYTSYFGILSQLRSHLRGIPYDETIFLTDVKVLDDIVTDTCPTVDGYYGRYKSEFG